MFPETCPADPYPHMPEEIVVAVPHLNQVRHVLDRARVQIHGRPEISPELDLARITLADATAAAAALDVLAPRDGRYPLPHHDDYISRILAALRRYFGRENAGWAPTLGKNRLLGSVNGGGGGVIHGGAGSPRRARGDWTTRASGPGAGVRVGVLDTALYAHPWLAGGWRARLSDRLPATPEQQEGAGHSTFVTGLILYQAPGATVEVRRVLTEDVTSLGHEVGRYSSDCWTVARNIVSLGRDLDVLNLSLVCYTEDGEPPLVLARAVDRLDRSVVVVAAAGNHGNLPAQPRWSEDRVTLERARASWPAALDGVVAVGAADQAGRPLAFTPNRKCWIDVLVNGDNLVSTYLSGPVTLEGGGRQRFKSWAHWSGTSFSAAVLTGAIAAGTEAGRVTARQSFEDLLEHAPPTPTDPDTYAPPFIPIDVLSAPSR